MPYLVLGLALLVGLLLLGRALAGADPALLARVVRWLIIALGSGALIYLFYSRQFQWASLVIFFLLPALVRWRAMKRMARNWAGPSPGRKSRVETRFLSMTLDHDTGGMSGTVIEGRFKGRELDDLDAEELSSLLRECRAGDEPSARILEAYLDRARRTEWREGWAEGASAGASAGANGGFAPGAMTREEAYEILGLKPGARAQEIKEAHRQLMAKIHPDRGGSTYLAAKINQAKDVLLNH
ncbi:MAG: DnaJ domain-containing protein [Alphaproteobacteria bacterium]